MLRISSGGESEMRSEPQKAVRGVEPLSTNTSNIRTARHTAATIIPALIVWRYKTVGVTRRRAIIAGDKRRAIHEAAGRAMRTYGANASGIPMS